MIKIVQGNILDSPEDILVQSVNCMGVMGSGLAKQIKQKYTVYQGYKKICNDHKNNPKELLGLVLFTEFSDRIIANVFGQVKYGRYGLFTNYEALRKGFETIYKEVNNEYKNKSVAIPYGIGCGLGGGDWNIVYGIIEEVFGDYDATIYKLD